MDPPEFSMLSLARTVRPDPRVVAAKQTAGRRDRDTNKGKTRVFISTSWFRHAPLESFRAWRRPAPSPTALYYRRKLSKAAAASLQPIPHTRQGLYLFPTSVITRASTLRVAVWCLPSCFGGCASGGEASPTMTSRASLLSSRWSRFSPRGEENIAEETPLPTPSESKCVLACGTECRRCSLAPRGYRPAGTRRCRLLRDSALFIVYTCLCFLRALEII